MVRSACFPRMPQGSEVIKTLSPALFHCTYEQAPAFAPHRSGYVFGLVYGPRQVMSGKEVFRPTWCHEDMQLGGKMQNAE